MYGDDRRESLPEPVAEAAARYNAPPPVPREEMWREIRARRAGTTAPAVQEPSPWRWLPATAAVAAGIAVLLMSPLAPERSGPWRPTAGRPEVEKAEPVFDDSALRLTLWDHFARAETLLALAKTELQAGRAGDELASAARNLLLDTRLLMDLVGPADVELEEILSGLELVFAQLAHLEANAAPDEIELAVLGIEASGLLPRLHAVVDATRLAGI